MHSGWKNASTMFFEAGLNNDKFHLLFLENQNAKVAIKTSKGLSRRIDIQNIVMQGSVWGSLFCTTTMDKLGEMAYQDESLLYLYVCRHERKTKNVREPIFMKQKCQHFSAICV